MAFSKLNIARDCWWLHSSGIYGGSDYYLADENMQQSTMEHGLYKSLNSDDADYIQMIGSGYYAPTYYCRLDTNNIVPSSVIVSARADNASRAYVEINGQRLGSFGFWDTLSTQQQTFYISPNDTIYKSIIEGRLNANYDNFSIRLVNSGDVTSTKLYNLEVFYSGDNTWSNYTSGLPNVESEVCYPSQLSFRGGSEWKNQAGEAVDPSGWYHINTSGVTADNTYIEHTTYPDLARGIWRDRRRPRRLDLGPQGGLGISFDTEAIEPLTSVTRAQLTLRMSLPPSGQYENVRDTFEVNGYNARYKEQDYKNEMPEEIGSIRAKLPRDGYFIYGVGDIVEQSGFMNYQVELDFINPQRADYDYSTIEHRNIDIFSGMDFRIVGLPSGTQISSAHLNIEYLPNDHLGLYTVGGVAIIRHWVDSYVDVGAANTPYFGDGAWQHRGNLHEGKIFDAFYKFDEVVASTTWPVSLNAASGAYGYYTNGITEEVVYDGDEVIDIIYEFEARDPTRRHIYRNPVRTEFGTTYDPTHYLHMIYNQSPLTTWDVHDPNASAYNPLTTNVYFEDRVVIGPSFTLYFMLYREPTNEGQQFGQFFTRGSLGSASATEYEIIGFLEPEKLSVTIKDVNEINHTLSVDLEAYTLEPILVWVTCDYDEDADETTFKLAVHPKIKNFFYEDWLYAEETFNYARRQLTDVYTCLGPLYSPSDLDQQLAFSQYMSWVSFCEFGWADSAIDLSYQTSTEDVRDGYDTSTDSDKRFFSSRLATSEYLHGRRKTDDTIGGDPLPPESSGWLLPTQGVSGGGGSIWANINGITDENNNNLAVTNPPWGLLAGEPTDWAIGYDFNISVPSGETPVGVEVQLRCLCNPNNAIETYKIQLGRAIWAGGSSGGYTLSPYGTNQVNTGPKQWRLDAQTLTYGASNSTWGMGSGLTADVLEDTVFAVGVQAVSPLGQYANAYIDWVKIRVYYSGDLGVDTIDTFKNLHWPVVTGSGAAERSTTYLIDQWRADEYSLYNPITTGGTHNIVHPSAIKVELDTEHITDHPSGVEIICDIEFDSGATDNWKVFRSRLTLGSGDYDGVYEITGFDKHINMDGQEIRFSDIDQINLKLTTRYADLGATEYHGDLKIKGLKVYFDSYSASVTGINILDLYVEGGIGESNNNMDLYLLAADVDSNNLDLYIRGIPFYASGEMPLFTEGLVPTTNNLPLYINGIPFYESGQMPLFTKAITWTTMPLYIEGLDPPQASGDMPLYTWATAAGVGGLYKKMTLAMTAESPWKMPLYLLAETPDSTSVSGDMTLMINSASGINETVYLYVNGHDVPNNNLSLYTTSAGVPSSSVALYTYGSGLPENKTTTIYTHGY